MRKNMICFSLSFSLFLPAPAFSAVFGDDNRNDLIDSNQYQLKNSVLAMVQSKHLVPLADDVGSLQLRPMPSSQYLEHNFCEDVKFIKQPVAADCTGFYIGNGLVMTAGHCVLELNETAKEMKTQKCANSSWVMNFEASNLKEDGKIELKKSDVFSCETVVSGALTRSLDYAVVRIKGDLDFLTPLKINPDAELIKDARVSMAGYPSGLPLKYTDQATIYYSSSSASYFKTDLDAFFGNSGSPVFNESLEVIGILTAGEVDYTIDQERQCARINVCRGVGRLCDVFSGQYGALGSVVTKIKSAVLDWQN